MENNFASTPARVMNRWVRFVGAKAYEKSFNGERWVSIKTPNDRWWATIEENGDLLITAKSGFGTLIKGVCPLANPGKKEYDRLYSELKAWLDRYYWAV